MNWQFLAVASILSALSVSCSANGDGETFSEPMNINTEGVTTGSAQLFVSPKCVGVGSPADVWVVLPQPAAVQTDVEIGISTSSQWAKGHWLNGSTTTTIVTVPPGAKASRPTKYYPEQTGPHVLYTTVGGSMDMTSALANASACGSSSPVPGGTPSTETFTTVVAKGQEAFLEPFAVVPGSAFKASMTGDGDADLYVRFGSAPTRSSYYCRPYVNGSKETCEVTTPDGQSQAFVMVHGYKASSFQLSVTHSSP